MSLWLRWSALTLTLFLHTPELAAAEPIFVSELLFPLENRHNHASSIVELPNGELLAAWYRGSGEHEADDVTVMGARRSKGASSWSAPFVMADTGDFPDGNPALFLDPQEKLWLFWSVVIANDWRTALVKYRVSSRYVNLSRSPQWTGSDIVLLVGKDLAREVHGGLDQYGKTNSAAGSAQLASIKKVAAEKYAARMGWITRSRPMVLPSGRMLLPIYSDALSISMMAISDDRGKTWSSGKPIVGLGNIQPSLVRKENGTLVAYMRNAGPPPRRLYSSTSEDQGVSWSLAQHTDLPNPGSAADVVRLRDGRWAIAYNDSEQGRHRLAVSLSSDEGRSWRWTRHLEFDGREQGAGQFHYPSMIQTRDGNLHVTYSYFVNHLGAPRKAIKHAAFSPEWVKAGDNAAR